MTYDEAIGYLSSLEPRGWRMGLDRMEAFIKAAGLDASLGAGPSSPRFIHVAGTNGKGSVTAYLQSMLVESGFRTGAFFSPFVVDPRERVQFGRDLIPKPDFAAIVADLQPIAESFTATELGGITEFEFKTAVGFEFWRRQACDWVALEVGLGGRLDATNVVHPACSVVVSIGLDHVNVLGDTIEKIAYEKAGVVKPAVPVVVGQMAESAAEVIESVARERNSPVWRVGREIEFHRQGSDTTVLTPAGELTLRPSLVGPIQSHNVAVAVAAMQLALDHPDPKALQDGAAHAAIPGRYQEIQIHGRRVILDGAHNTDAARTLKTTLAERSPDLHPAVIGMTVGHEPDVFLREIKPQISCLHTAPIDFHRSQDPAEIAAAGNRLGIPSTAHATLAEAYQAASQAEGDVLVTGSFYLVGEFLRTF